MGHRWVDPTVSVPGKLLIVWKAAFRSCLVSYLSVTCFPQLSTVVMHSGDSNSFLFISRVDLPWRKSQCQHSCSLWPSPIRWPKTPRSNQEPKRTQRTLGPNCPRPSPEVEVNSLLAPNCNLIHKDSLILGIKCVR